MVAAHRAVLGRDPEIVALNATTDARFYRSTFDRPALCYGPRVENMHGVDERVDLDSVVEGAAVLARFMTDWFRAGRPAGAA